MKIHNAHIVSYEYDQNSFRVFCLCGWEETFTSKRGIKRLWMSKAQMYVENIDAASMMVQRHVGYHYGYDELAGWKYLYPIKQDKEAYSIDKYQGFL